MLVASIEEMAFGKFMEQKYAFTVQVPADATNEGKISLASVTEEGACLALCASGREAGSGRKAGGARAVGGGV